MSAADQETADPTSIPVSNKNKVLETGASLAQDLFDAVFREQSFAPVKAICAHLNAFHVYDSDRNRCVEANHYCSHISEGARLIGVEYMISGKLYDTLDSDERKLWHSHVFEVKSGMLIMPGPEGLLAPGWEMAERKEMEEVVGLYGKTFHFWQVDRGDKLPLGMPQLMASFTSEEQLPKGLLAERDERYRVSSEAKSEKRRDIAEPEIHPGEWSPKASS
ncbi:MAG: hypothetical protein Q9178_003715 [Gyalolechia marmorata]